MTDTVTGPGSIKLATANTVVLNDGNAGGVITASVSRSGIPGVYRVVVIDRVSYKVLGQRYSNASGDVTFYDMPKGPNRLMVIAMDADSGGLNAAIADFQEGA